MSDSFCPLIKKPCMKWGCDWYIQLLGQNPQTGQEIHDFGCAISWLPMLLIEGSQQTRQAGSAIESFRNEVIKTQLLVDGDKNLPTIENQAPTYSSAPHLTEKESEDLIHTKRKPNTYSRTEASKKDPDGADPYPPPPEDPNKEVLWGGPVEKLNKDDKTE